MKFTHSTFQKVLSMVELGSTIIESLDALKIAKSSFYRNLSTEQKNFLRLTKLKK